MKFRANFFLGVDPGAKGGAVILDSDGTLMCVSRFDGQCPGRISAEVAGAAARMAGPLGQVTIAIEKVGAAPGQGVASMFSFGVGLGLIKGWLAASGFQFLEVAPQSWQRVAVAEGETTKDRARALAASLWGLDPFIFAGCRVPHQGCIDAAGLAEYLRQTVTGLRPPIAAPKPKAKRKPTLKL
jgi:crossover junction endodeoxyribonuclease RuvC